MTRFFDSDQVSEALPWPALLEAVESIFAMPGAEAPERAVHQVATPSGGSGSLLLKPGWVVGEVIVVKAVTFFGDNGERGLPTVNAGVLVFDAVTGTFRGACDGNVLTARRTAAASAVAARHLAKADARRLLVVGTGALAPLMAEAHRSVRPIDQVSIWGRDRAKAQAVVDTVAGRSLAAEVAPDLDEAVAGADIVSCVTGSTEPLVKGAVLAPGVHVDLVGSFSADMREADDALISRGSVWVDTRGDAVLAGDLAQPLATGVLQPDDIVGDLAEIIAGTCARRSDSGQITVFKSAGTALEDVAAAKLVFGQ